MPRFLNDDNLQHSIFFIYVVMRFFKTIEFAKASRVAKITDPQLQAAIQQTLQGRVIDLGGGVFKKRLLENRYRSILVTDGSSRWVYEYLFAKKDLANITEQDLQRFRVLAKRYAVLSEQQIDALLMDKLLLELSPDVKPF